MNFKNKIKLSVFTLLMLSTSVATAAKGVDFLYGVGIAAFATQDDTNLTETDATAAGEILLGFEEAGFAFEFALAKSMNSGTSVADRDYQATVQNTSLVYRTIERNESYYKFKFGKMEADWDFSDSAGTANTDGNVFGVGMGIRSSKDTRIELEYMLYSSKDVDNTHMVVLRYVFDGTPPDTGFR